MTTEHTLNDIYAGMLQHFPAPGVGPNWGKAVIPGVDLLDPARLSALIAEYGRRSEYDGMDFRAIASTWSKFYFIALMVPVVGANVLFRQALPLAFDQLGLEVDEKGLPHRLWLRDNSSPLTTRDAFARFQPLFVHLERVNAAFKSVAGISDKVLWNNAGNVFEHFAHSIFKHPLLDTQAEDPVREIVESPELPDGWRNPLFQPVRYLDWANQEEPLRIRRLCCIRYLLPPGNGPVYCGSCPLKPDNLPAVRAAGPARLARARSA